MDNQDTKPTQPPTTGAPPVLPREDTGTQSTNPSTPPVVVASKPRRKGLVIGIIIAVIALLLAGGAAAYFFWYQNPEKVVSDGIMHAVGSKTASLTGEVTAGDNLKVTLDGRSSETSAALSAKATFKQNNQDTNLNGDIVFDNFDALYAKVDGIDTLLEGYRTAAQGNPEAAAQIDALIAKIDNKWIKMTNDTNESETKERRCMSDTVKKIQNDDSMVSELVGLYKKHKFIKIEKELGSKDGSLGYSLKFDNAAANEMTKSFKETKAYKDLKACDPDFEVTESEMSSTPAADDKMHTEIWVSQWGHQITKVSFHDMSSADGFKVTIEPTFDDTVAEVKAPQEFTTLKDVNAEVEALQGALFMPMLGGSSSSGNMGQ